MPCLPRLMGASMGQAINHSWPDYPRQRVELARSDAIPWFNCMLLRLSQPDARPCIVSDCMPAWQQLSQLQAAAAAAAQCSSIKGQLPGHVLS